MRYQQLVLLLFLAICTLATPNVKPAHIVSDFESDEFVKAAIKPIDEPNFVETSTEAEEGGWPFSSSSSSKPAAPSSSSSSAASSLFGKTSLMGSPSTLGQMPGQMPGQAPGVMMGVTLVTRASPPTGTAGDPWKKARPWKCCRICPEKFYPEVDQQYGVMDLAGKDAIKLAPAPTDQQLATKLIERSATAKRLKSKASVSSNLRLARQMFDSHKKHLLQKPKESHMKVKAGPASEVYPAFVEQFSCCPVCSEPMMTSFLEVSAKAKGQQFPLPPCCNFCKEKFYTPDFYPDVVRLPVRMAGGPKLDDSFVETSSEVTPSGGKKAVFNAVAAAAAMNAIRARAMSDHTLDIQHHRFAQRRGLFDKAASLASKAGSMMSSAAASAGSALASAASAVGSFVSSNPLATAGILGGLALAGGAAMAMMSSSKSPGTFTADSMDATRPLPPPPRGAEPTLQIPNPIPCCHRCLSRCDDDEVNFYWNDDQDPYYSQDDDFYAMYANGGN